jgi:hypothetical protein
MTRLERAHCSIELSWVKVHAGIVGNELADRPAKTAASDSGVEIAFNRLPISTFISKVKEETQRKWQKEWDECTKARITKEFSPKVQDRHKLKIDINPTLTAMVTGHGKTRAYLHRFKILEHATCPCGNGKQTAEHTLDRCPVLNAQRELFKRNFKKSGKWQANIHEPISKQLKSFILFIK